MSTVQEKVKNIDETDKKDYEDYLRQNGDKYKNGPIDKRSCTDWPCCIIFLAFIAAFFAAGAYGYKEGDPNKLLIGWDSNS
jgi:hypothetical protein